ncbi:hypothetical protein AB7M69_006153 [Bradyrhizobium japonicum]
MRVIRSSGSVRGGDGNIPAYSACGQPQRHAAFALGPCEPMIALVSVDLKDAVEALEDALSMVTTASWRVVVDHDWWISAAVAAIVAQDSPQIAGLRSAPARIEHRRPGLVL